MRPKAVTCSQTTHEGTKAMQEAAMRQVPAQIPCASVPAQDHAHSPAFPTPGAGGA